MRCAPDAYSVSSFNRRREASPRATTFDYAALDTDTRFQSQTRSQSPCDSSSSKACCTSSSCFNRRREASPRATVLYPEQCHDWHNVSIADAKPVPVRPCAGCVGTRANRAFQSQTRSQSPCDPFQHSVASSPNVRFNRRREASPRATAEPGEGDAPARGFNRRREASPRATQERLLLGSQKCSVSIADAKPVPVRHNVTPMTRKPSKRFQSQTRSQSPCDAEFRVGDRAAKDGFNRRREASPRATRFKCRPFGCRDGFNRRREASPRATLSTGHKTVT